MLPRSTLQYIQPPHPVCDSLRVKICCHSCTVTMPSTVTRPVTAQYVWHATSAPAAKPHAAITSFTGYAAASAAQNSNLEGNGVHYLADNRITLARLVPVRPAILRCCLCACVCTALHTQKAYPNIKPSCEVKDVRQTVNAATCLTNTSSHLHEAGI